jgi:hypothetical protein
MATQDVLQSILLELKDLKLHQEGLSRKLETLASAQSAQTYSQPDSGTLGAQTLVSSPPASSPLPASLLSATPDRRASKGLAHLVYVLHDSALS